MKYNSKPQIFTAIVFCLIGYPFYHYNDGFLSVAFTLGFMVVIGLCLFIPRLTIVFYTNTINVKSGFENANEINKKDILDVSITNKKIYIQTKHKILQ